MNMFEAMNMIALAIVIIGPIAVFGPIVRDERKLELVSKEKERVNNDIDKKRKERC